MNAGIAIHPLPVMTAAEWPFHDATALPSWRPPGGGRTARFDPFPAYAHNHATIAATAEHVERCTPPLWPVELYNADREEIGRSNGWSNITEPSRHDGEQWVRDTPTGLIVLSGKRVPPHPAMTRYLVAHEYGHNITWMINLTRGATHAHDSEIEHEYASMRALPDNTHPGTGGRWHDSIAEIMACDYRLTVCGVEPEYWPHLGIPRPEDVPAVADWWTHALADLDTARANSSSSPAACI